METQKSPIELACEIVGSQAEMARRLEVPPTMVNQWTKGARPVPVEYCKAIERLTGGVVTVQSLYPDGWKKVWPELIKPKRTKIEKAWDGVERRTGPADRRTHAKAA